MLRRLAGHHAGWNAMDLLRGHVGSLYWKNLPTDFFRLLLFLVYFPRATPDLPALAHSHDSIKPPGSSTAAQPTYRTALAVTLICIVHAFITAILSLYFSFAAPQYLQSFANTLGILSTILAIIQYFPQIYTTWVLRRVASLSIPMMCIQTPGSFVWAASLAARLGAGGWSAWGVYMVTGCLQGSLRRTAITHRPP